MASRIDHHKRTRAQATPGLAATYADRREALDSGQVQIDATAAITTAANQCDLDVVDIEIKATGGDYRIVVLADRLPGRGGITLDDCARLSLAIQARLDTNAGFAERYEIEVSSPGMERPLRHLADCARYCGMDVRVQFSSDRAQIVSVTGTLVNVDIKGQTFALRPPSAKGKPAPALTSIAWEHVRSANLAPTLAQWQALGARLAAETPDIALDQTDGAHLEGQAETSGPAPDA